MNGCNLFIYDDLSLQTLDMCSLLHQIIIIDTRILLEESFYLVILYRHDLMFLYGLRDSTQCILIDISILCYQFFVVYLFVDVKINLIQCQCQCLNDRERALLSFWRSQSSSHFPRRHNT